MDTPLFAEVCESLGGFPKLSKPRPLTPAQKARRMPRIRKAQDRIMSDAVDAARTPEGGW